MVAVLHNIYLPNNAISSLIVSGSPGDMSDPLDHCSFASLESHQCSLDRLDLSTFVLSIMPVMNFSTLHLHCLAIMHPCTCHSG